MKDMTDMRDALDGPPFFYEKQKTLRQDSSTVSSGF